MAVQQPDASLLDGTFYGRRTTRFSGRRQEEIDDGIWNVYFGPMKLGRFNERNMRIEDQFGRLKRHDM
jgi:hypothetical protein